MKYQTYEITCGAKVFKVAARSPNDMLDAINGLDCCVGTTMDLNWQDGYILPGSHYELRRVISEANAERFGHAPPAKLYFAVSPLNAKQAVWVEAYQEAQIQEAVTATDADYRKMGAVPDKALIDFFLPREAGRLRKFLLASQQQSTEAP